MSYKPKVGAQMASPNVIPMADIMLVLLIIFMVVTPMLQKSLPVDMARVNNAKEMQEPDRRAIMRPGVDCGTVLNERRTSGPWLLPKGQEHITVSQTPAPKVVQAVRHTTPSGAGSYRNRSTPYKCTEPYRSSRC